MTDLRLISLDRGMLGLINEKRNDESLVSNLGANFRYTPIEVDEIWYEGYLKDFAQQERCVIEYKVNKKWEVTGLTSLNPINWINRSAEFSIQLYDNTGIGLGYRATEMMLKHGFKNLNLNRIWLHVKESNERAIKTYIKSGFKVEGILRESLFKDGKYENQQVMSILKEEYDNIG